ncbi:hypothetical protein M413DRAFT_439968 [Hebeloma cylindrosporum]|uniref:ditrans,polycis-polyprenyl diphosphate synthase [(2E,6E)-farnesyldiphosphate specific] n=1 Tax=Hebeloma cylindrosporum TaxID=76867 RepID=A0A0C2Z4W4_HEBCY|nr:hypothetical protein M413DRAFT_439968 [Hebeloma cylindrosporum h7]
MRVLFALLLYAFHFIYTIIVRVRCLWPRSSTAPQPIQSTRHRIPKHLAIVFVINEAISLETVQDVLCTSVLNAVEWCQSIGIKKLTVYDERDMLSRCTQRIRESFPVHAQEHRSESEAYRPLTPPPSDYSESRPLSPTQSHGDSIPVTKIHIPESVPNKESRKVIDQSKKGETTHKHDLLLCLLSKESSKGAIATVARALARAQRYRPRKNLRSSKLEAYRLSVDELEQALEDEDGLSSPNFMIIHPIDSPYTYPSPPELHGFPPWHIRLTEIFVKEPWFTWRTSPMPLPLDENTFREALDEFASAEMRFGK